MKTLSMNFHQKKKTLLAKLIEKIKINKVKS